MDARMTAIVAGCAALAAASAIAAETAECSAKSAGLAPVVVELYTSEGCNSCPPADRWLSTLKDRPSVLALGFHVDYWDRLGWVDRFATPAHTARQRELQATSGAAFVYTPQVIVDGRDWNWRAQALPRPRPATIEATLTQRGRHVEAVVEPRPGAPDRLAAYWVVLEDGHVSRVRAGENAGVTLEHDRVVRGYRPASEWSAAGGAHRLTFDPPASDGDERRRRVALVVHDARTARPLQAVELVCDRR